MDKNTAGAKMVAKEYKNTFVLFFVLCLILDFFSIFFNL